MSTPYLLQMVCSLLSRAGVYKGCPNDLAIWKIIFEVPINSSVQCPPLSQAFGGGLSITITQDDYVHELVHRKRSVAQPSIFGLFTLVLAHGSTITPFTSERQRADDSDNPLCDDYPPMRDKVHLRNMGPD
ncbi:hypothetical protein F4604DRAFT_1680834 [Suillus subluteus]|nr:hypothetical protein F4604DRAFT_1680834 [Suillus subluteus]